jgi:hypothetical protein
LCYKPVQGNVIDCDSGRKEGRKEGRREDVRVKPPTTATWIHVKGIRELM